MDEEDSWKNSKLLPYAVGVADALRGIVGDNLERLEKNLTQPSSSPAAST
jgi:hypothetical protein